MAKLTLSVDDRIIARAKKFAKSRGISVSKMVGDYLDAVADPATPSPSSSPVLRSVRGVLKHADINEYREHLTKKYR